MRLHAGPFHMMYEQGSLRRICLGEEEVLRMIYAALRDRNWGTYPVRIEAETVEQDADGFVCRCLMLHPDAEGRSVFRWQVQISGSSGGVIEFGIDGEALVDVWKNRAGFCVLHPIRGLGNAPVELLHTDGSRSRSVFPDLIAAANPFHGLRGMRWAAGGRGYRLDFEGEVFETEDQRNWTDASYKTFCTPLARPFPVLLRRGERVQQRIRFQPDSQPLAAGGGTRPLPGTVPSAPLRLGTCASALEPEAAAWLRTLGLSHLRADVYPGAPGWIPALRAACDQAAGLALPLELVLHLRAPFGASFEAFRAVWDAATPLAQVLLLAEDALATPQPLIGLLPDIRAALGNPLAGVGTDFNFAELNRNRFDPGAADFVSFSLHPQEHAFDDQSLMENTEAQYDAVRSAAAVYGLPVHVSPITLRKRFNPYASDPAQRAVPRSSQADPRQHTEFAAEWTRASLQQLTAAGAASATYYLAGDLAGALGPYPAYHALARA